MDTNTIITILTIIISTVISLTTFKVSIQKDMEYTKERLLEKLRDLKEQINKLTKAQEKYNRMQTRLLKVEMKLGLKNEEE